MKNAYLAPVPFHVPIFKSKKNNKQTKTIIKKTTLAKKPTTNN
jgi:hypothetical protein